MSKVWRRSARVPDAARWIAGPGEMWLGDNGALLAMSWTVPGPALPGAVFQWQIRRSTTGWETVIASGEIADGFYADDYPDQWPSSNLYARVRRVMGEALSGWTESAMLAAPH